MGANGALSSKRAGTVFNLLPDGSGEGVRLWSGELPDESEGDGPKYELTARLRPEAVLSAAPRPSTVAAERPRRSVESCTGSSAGTSSSIS